MQRITRFFEEVLGYDPIGDLSFEARLKNKYVDLETKIDGKVKLLIECKGAGVNLKQKHIQQAELYASENNYRWVLLTNGVQWTLYHLTFAEGIEYEVAFHVDLSDDAALERSAEALSILHKQSMKRDEHESYWRKRCALGADSLGRALLHEDVLRVLRAQVRKDEGMLVDVEDLAHALHGMLSQEAREHAGPVRIRWRRSAKAKASASPDATVTPPSTASHGT